MLGVPSVSARQSVLTSTVPMIASFGIERKSLLPEAA
jgi:hypothetical protein